MPSIIAKRKRNKTYYYVATSKRVDGKPRIVQQTYLGTAERIERLLRDRTAPVPLDVTALELGLPGALWLAASSSGAFDALLSLWPAPAKGPSTARFLLLAAIQRVCCPGPKTKVGAWYERTVPRRLWGFPPEAFRDRFDAIRVADPQDPDADEDDLQRAQHALLDAFRQRELVGQRVLACDSTSFHTWVASDNARNTLAQRGSNKQRRNDLRQVGLSCALDGERGLVLAHRVYPGNVSDSLELPAALQRIGRVLDRPAIPRGDVTLVVDKGTAAPASTLELQRAGLGWVSELPWNQAPESLRSAGDDRLQPMGKAARGLQRLAREVSKPNARHTERGLRNRIRKHLAADCASRLLRCELERDGDRWRLDFALDREALNRLQTERFGRTTLLTSRLDWSAAQVVAACRDGQQRVERVFRDLEGGGHGRLGPAAPLDGHQDPGACLPLPAGSVAAAARAAPGRAGLARPDVGAPARGAGRAGAVRGGVPAGEGGRSRAHRHGRVEADAGAGGAGGGSGPGPAAGADRRPGRPGIIHPRRPLGPFNTMTYMVVLRRAPVKSR